MSNPYEQDEWYAENDEERLADIQAELEYLYDVERLIAPYVDDGVRHTIYRLQDMRNELKMKLAEQGEEDEEDIEWNARRAMDMFGPDGYDEHGNPFVELG